MKITVECTPCEAIDMLKSFNNTTNALSKENAVSPQNERKRQEIIENQIQMLLGANRYSRGVELAQVSLALDALLRQQRDFEACNDKNE